MPTPTNPPTTTWRRSSRCNSGACVEVRTTVDAVQVRDTTGTTLTVPAPAWTQFLAAVKAGDLDGAA